MQTSPQGRDLTGSRVWATPASAGCISVFRSVRRAAADLARLKEHDDQAYAAALEAGGLLRYFKGEVNGHRECLSFCLWERKEQAVTLPLVAPSTGLRPR